MDKTSTQQNLTVTQYTITNQDSDALPSKRVINAILNYSKSLQVLHLKTTASLDVILN
jgi:hypothetical protein